VGPPLQREEGSEYYSSPVWPLLSKRVISLSVFCFQLDLTEKKQRYEFTPHSCQYVRQPRMLKRRVNTVAVFLMQCESSFRNCFVNYATIAQFLNLSVIAALKYWLLHVFWHWQGNKPYKCVTFPFPVPHRGPGRVWSAVLTPSSGVQKPPMLKWRAHTAVEWLDVFRFLIHNLLLIARVYFSFLIWMSFRL
jgi:hypothetical protein